MMVFQTRDLVGNIPFSRFFLCCMQQYDIQVEPFSYLQENIILLIALKRFKNTKRPIQGLLLVHFQI